MDTIVYLWNVNSQKPKLETGRFGSGDFRFKVVVEKMFFGLQSRSRRDLSLHMVKCVEGQEVDLEVTITTTGGNSGEKPVGHWKVLRLNKKLPIHLQTDQISLPLSDVNGQKLQLLVVIYIIQTRPETGQPATVESGRFPTVSNSTPLATVQPQWKRQKIDQSSARMDRSAPAALDFPLIAPPTVSNVGKVPLNKKRKVKVAEVFTIDDSDDEFNGGSEDDDKSTSSDDSSDENVDRSKNGDVQSSSSTASKFANSRAKAKTKFQLKEENRRLTSTVDKMRLGLERTAQVADLKTELIAKVTDESKIKSVSIDKLKKELLLKSGVCNNFQIELELKSELLRKENDSVSSQKAKIVDLCDAKANLEAQLIALQCCFDQQKIELDNRLDTMKSLSQQLEQTKGKLINQQQLNDRHTEQINRQSKLIVEQSGKEETLRSQLTKANEEVQLLKVTVAQLTVDQAASIATLQSQLSVKSVEIDEISGELKLKLESVDKLAEQSEIQAETIGKLTDELKIKSESVEILHTEVESKVEQLQVEREAVKSHQAEIANITETIASMKAKLSDFQTLLDGETTEVNKLTSELSNQRLVNDQNLEEISRSTIGEKIKMKENFSSEINRMIEDRLKLEESLRAELFKANEEVERLTATVAQLTIDNDKLNAESAQKESNSAATAEPIDTESEVELRPYPGWPDNYSKYADFKVVTVDGFEFGVSRWKVSLVSDVFITLFDANMIEKGVGQVFIQDVTGDVMFEVFKFAYEGKPTRNFPAVVKEVYYAAEKYNISGLKSICQARLVGRQVTVNSICDSIKMAKMFGGNQLLAKCVKFIWDRTDDPQMPWGQLGKICGDEEDLLKKIVQLGVEKMAKLEEKPAAEEIPLKRKRK